MNYKEGDRIAYSTGGGIRIVTVDCREDDIKNGRPGFDGTMDDGTTVWGYDAQITKVFS